MRAQVGGPGAGDVSGRGTSATLMVGTLASAGCFPGGARPGGDRAFHRAGRSPWIPGTVVAAVLEPQPWGWARRGSSPRSPRLLRQLLATALEYRRHREWLLAAAVPCIPPRARRSPSSAEVACAAAATGAHDPGRGPGRLDAVSTRSGVPSPECLQLPATATRRRRCGHLQGPDGLALPTRTTKHPEEPLGSVNAGSMSKLSRQRSRFRGCPSGLRRP